MLLARALHGASFASSANAREHLAEAARVIDQMPKEMLQRRSVTQLRQAIAEELQKRS